MSNKHKFGFLSTIDDPLLPYWIASAQQFEIQNIIVICDSQKRSEKLQMIWEKLMQC